MDSTLVETRHQDIPWIDSCTQATRIVSNDTTGSPGLSSHKLALDFKIACERVGRLTSRKRWKQFCDEEHLQTSFSLIKFCIFRIDLIFIRPQTALLWVRRNHQNTETNKNICQNFTIWRHMKLTRRHKQDATHLFTLLLTVKTSEN